MSLWSSLSKLQRRTASLNTFRWLSQNLQRKPDLKLLRYSAKLTGHQVARMGKWNNTMKENDLFKPSIAVPYPKNTRTWHQLRLWGKVSAKQRKLYKWSLLQISTGCPVAGPLRLPGQSLLESDAENCCQQSSCHRVTPCWHFATGQAGKDQPATTATTTNNQ